MPKFGLLVFYTVDYVFEIEADNETAAEAEFDRLVEAGKLPEPTAVEHKGWEIMQIARFLD